MYKRDFYTIFNRKRMDKKWILFFYNEKSDASHL
jgi:hypothetical protein